MSHVLCVIIYSLTTMLRINVVFFFFTSFFAVASLCLEEPLCSRTSINCVSPSFSYLYYSRQGLCERERKKKLKCTSQSAACKFPEPEEIFQSNESPRRLTNCERPRCDRWISGLPGRPPRPSRTLAQPPIFSDSRKTAEIITTPFNWRIKMRQ